MKKNYFIAILALVVNLASAQIEPTTYRGAFAPAPTAMWTDSWTNFDPQNEPYTDAATVVNVTTNITASTTWTTGKTYKITGLIYVTNNATLTIQPGVVVKGIYTNTGTALVITKGAKLNAIGTAAAPIVFTSAKAAGTRASGDWGGVILLGKAHFNLNDGINNIEGITATVNTEYGGGLTPDDNDSSGTMKYCRIEFPGFVFSPNNEINGLTFGAVGRGTTIDNVQVSFSGDDSFEWFGGSVNCKHLVAYRGLDDDFDTDNGFKGICQFLLGVRDPAIADNPAISTSEGFESDNNASGTTGSYSNSTPYDITTAIFSNCTLIGPRFRTSMTPSIAIASGHARAARLRRAGQQKIFNSIFLDFKSNILFVDGAVCATNATNGTLAFHNNILAGALDATFPGGCNFNTVNEDLNTTTKAGLTGNTVLSSSAGILTQPYDASGSSLVYTGLDYRPGATAATGADFSSSYLTPYITVVVGSTPSVTNRFYCKGDVTTPLNATLTSTGVSLKWYTAATGGVASTTAPTPTSTAAGVKTYYVSQLDGSNVESARVALTVTVNALPTEAVSVITGTPPSGYTSAVAVGPYVGTTTTFTYSVTPFVDNSLSYLWSVPNGVNIISGQGTNTLVVNYANAPSGAGTLGTIAIQAVNANGCGTLKKTLTISKALPASPGTMKIYDDSVSTIKNVTTCGGFLGTAKPVRLVATAAAGVNTYKWELPTGVTVYIPITGVTTSSYTRYFTAIPFDAPLTVLPAPSVGTKFWQVDYTANTFAVNGVTTTVTTSTCTQLIQGGSTYGATTSQAYAPYGTTITSNKNAILIKFSGVSSTSLLFIGAKSVNGVGTSFTNDATLGSANPGALGLFNNTYSEVYTSPVPPSTNATSVISVSGTAVSTAKLLKLAAAIPTAPTAVAGQIAGICPNSSVSYTITPGAQASAYSIVAPSGSVVTSALHPSNATNTLTTSDLTFTVAFDANIATTLPKTIVITSVNALGSSVASKTLTLTTGMAGLTVPTTNPTTFSGTANTTLTVNPAAGAVSYTWVLANGATLVSQSANSATIEFSAVLGSVSSTMVKVSATNSCGVSSALKSITLTRAAKMAVEAVVPTNNTIEVYPNPASDSFNADVTAVTGGKITMSIYTINGSLVSTRNLDVTEGYNTTNENISSLSGGMYFVQFVNETTNETIVKKLVKR